MVRIDEAKITRQGQISVPKKVRAKLHLEPGDKVVFLEDENGRVIIQEAEVPVEFTKDQWQEFLEKTQKEPVTRFKTKTEALRHLDKLSGEK